MEKHYVSFLSAGTLFAEESMVEIESWDVEMALKMSSNIVERYGSRPYGFQFITKGRADADLDSKVIAKSGIYYINGIVKTYEEILSENNPDNRILISNMKNNNWEKIVVTYNPYKWTRPFYSNDAVVSQ